MDMTTEGMDYFVKASDNSVMKVSIDNDFNDVVELDTVSTPTGSSSSEARVRRERSNQPRMRENHFWSTFENEVVLLTVEKGYGWAATIALLGMEKKDYAAAKSHQQSLIRTRQIDPNTLPARKASFKPTIDEACELLDRAHAIAREEALDPEAADEAHDVYVTNYMAAERDKAPTSRPHRSRRQHKEAYRHKHDVYHLNPNWTPEEDEILCNAWFSLKDEQEIADMLTGKNKQMVSARRIFLQEGNDENGNRASEVYKRVREEYNADLVEDDSDDDDVD